jgi:hypothetical protein
MTKYHDYPLEACASAAKKIATDGNDVYQKWTCVHCGSRQTMGEANKFFTSGICEECNGVTPITKCNYMVIGKFSTMKDIIK